MCVVRCGGEGLTSAEAEGWEEEASSGEGGPVWAGTSCFGVGL